MKDYKERLKKQLLEQLETYGWKLSDRANCAVDNLITEYDYENENDFKDKIYEECDFMYYEDAFDYLKDEGIWEFEEAISEGFGVNICTIAEYYLEGEIRDFVRKYLDFEIKEDEEE